MKIIKPGVVCYGAVPTTRDEALRFIEMAGRTCYRSEDRITPTSSGKFVQGLIRAGHLAMVEHSNFVVRTRDYDAAFAVMGRPSRFLNKSADDNYWYIGGNITAWYKWGARRFWSLDCFEPFVRQYGDLFGIKPKALLDEGDWEICPDAEIPKELHRYSVKFICDRGVSHELVRHRPCSFAQESTRYVNYYGKDIEFIEPNGFQDWDEEMTMEFLNSCFYAESRYQRMVKPVGRLTPQQVRAILPNALKTEIVVTCELEEWKWIFSLRCEPDAHPDFQRVAKMAREEFVKRGLL